MKKYSDVICMSIILIIAFIAKIEGKLEHKAKLNAIVAAAHFQPDSTEAKNFSNQSFLMLK